MDKLYSVKLDATFAAQSPDEAKRLFWEWLETEMATGHVKVEEVS